MECRAADAASGLIREALEAGGPDSIGLLGGARGMNEDAFAWAQLADALGITYRDAQFGDGLPAEILGLNRATIDEAASASTIVMLGADIKEELPVLYLRLRDAVVEKRSKLVEFSSVDTGMTRYATQSIRHQPGLQTEAVNDAKESLTGENVVVVVGRGNLAESADETMAALAAVLAVNPDAKILPALRRGNVVGALSVGMAPADADHDGLATLRAAADGKLELLILLGADPINDCPDTDLARRALAGARRVISIDTHPSESSKLADVVLAGAAYGEKAGTTTNLEGRVSTVSDKVTTTGTARPDWMIAAELAIMLDIDGDIADVASVADVTAAIAAEVPGFAGVTLDALAADRNGVLVTVSPKPLGNTVHGATQRNTLRPSARRGPKALRSGDRYGHVAFHRQARTRCGRAPAPPGPRRARRCRRWRCPPHRQEGHRDPSRRLEPGHRPRCRVGAVQPGRRHDRRPDRRIRLGHRRQDRGGVTMRSVPRSRRPLSQVADGRLQ